MLLSALSAKPKYTPDEAAIRDTFDSFFTRLGYFETYIIAGVIVEKQLKTYLIYWMDLLHGKKPGIMNAETVEGIWSYLVLHDFNDTLALLLHFGDRPGVMVRTDVSKDILGSM